MKTKRAGLELKGVTSNFGAGESVCTMYERNEEPSTLTTVNHQELRRRSVARPTCFNANRRHFAQPYTLVPGGGKKLVNGAKYTYSCFSNWNIIPIS